YVRTPNFLIHPDVVWAVHINYGVEKKHILYHNDKEVPLVEGYADYMSYIAKGLEWINKKIKPFVEQYMLGDNRERKEDWDKVQAILQEFVEESVTEVALGFHAMIDKDRLINYSEVQPYKAVLNYYIFQMVLFSIALDVLLLYLTRGKVAPSMYKAAKVAKRLKKAQKTIKKFQDQYDLTFHMPQISMNAAIYKEQHGIGKVTTIIEYALRADPFFGISTEYEFEPKRLPKALKKFKVKAIVEGKISFDINIRYNTLTGEFLLTNSAKDQKAGGNHTLQPGDILQMQGAIGLELEGEIKVEDKREKVLLKVFPIKTHVKIEGKVVLNSAVGITRRFGIHPDLGPYLEDTLFFDGITGEYFQNVEFEVMDQEWFDSNEEDEPTKIPKFGEGTASLGRMYIFEIFNPHDRKKYYNETN
ncbi:hypothetical protein, partial [Aquimarina longa]|uniref:hypothetical protein n=1 Tax=Aquimarina longa TaxID=1080221 RepID=UPI0009EB7F47